MNNNTNVLFNAAEDSLSHPVLNSEERSHGMHITDLRTQHQAETKKSGLDSVIDTALQSALDNRYQDHINHAVLVQIQTEADNALKGVLKNLAVKQRDTEDIKESAASKRDKAGQDTPLRFKDAIFIKQNYKYHKIAHKDILYLKADGNYAYIHTPNKTYIVKYSLQALIAQFLDADYFVRVHRSFAINARHILSFNETVVAIATKEIPIGPNYRADFMKLFLR